VTAHGTRLLYSAAEDYLEPATQELRELFPDAAFAVLGPDLGAIEAEGLAIGDLASACREAPTVFIRHLMREVGTIPLAAAGEIDQVVSTAVDTWTSLPLQPEASLQVWTSGESGVPWRTDALRAALAEALSAEGVQTARAGKSQVLGVVVSGDGISLGLNGAANALSDWPGGRVRLAKPKGQISRSEFKLEELFRVHTLPFPQGGTAIDLGASPGGWTRILRQHGFTVWAVDPARLDPRLAGDPGVRHVRTTAGPFLASTDVSADLVVNDMRMEPDLSVSVMLGAARRIAPGGMMIQTLKVTPQHTLATVRRALDALRHGYEIVWAGQLHHNRNEVTVVGRKRS